MSIEQWRRNSIFRCMLLTLHFDIFRLGFLGRFWRSFDVNTHSVMHLIFLTNRLNSITVGRCALHDIKYRLPCVKCIQARIIFSILVAPVTSDWVSNLNIVISGRRLTNRHNTAVVGLHTCTVIAHWRLLLT